MNVKVYGNDLMIARVYD